MPLSFDSANTFAMMIASDQVGLTLLENLRFFENNFLRD